MTRVHFEQAAKMINAIRQGEWTMDRPSFAVQGGYDYNVDPYVRAVQTAEAFIRLFQGVNPRFNEDRFLVACGLQEK